MSLALAVGLCLACGYLLVAALGPRGNSLGCRLLRLSLSPGFGIGLFSLAMFLHLTLLRVNLIVIDLGMCALLVGGFLNLRGVAAALEQPPAVSYPSSLRKWIAAGFLIALAVAIYSSLVQASVHPHGGGWDAFAIWNLHARFLLRGGLAWLDGFTSTIPWSHPDYPLLLPAAISHFWTYLGHETQAVPAGIGLIFGFSTVGILIAALTILRGSAHATLASMALLATPFFIEQSASQYADVPLSFFFLAAVAIPCIAGSPARWDSLVLSGMAAGLAAWTKNEGLLFLLSLLTAHAWIAVRSRSAARCKETSMLFLGALPALATTLWFKHSFGPPGDLFADHAAVHKLLDLHRYWVILNWYGKEFLRFGNWWLLPGTLVLVVFYFLAGRASDVRKSPDVSAGTLTLALTLVGYFAIYLITPYDLYWHLRFSLNRLFLHLWPSAVFLFFLAFPEIMKKTAHAEGPKGGSLREPQSPL